MVVLKINHPKFATEILRRSANIRLLLFKVFSNIVSHNRLASIAHNRAVISVQENILIVLGDYILPYRLPHTDIRIGTQGLKP